MTGSRSLFERHPKATLVAVVLVSVALADAAVTRWVAPALEVARDDSYRTRVLQYHHGLKPMQAVPTRWGSSVYRVFTNSLGFRDARPREVPLRSTHRRLLLLGDSFTEGIGVDYEASFAGLLGAALAPEGVEVLNAGVASHSPVIYLRRTRHLLDEVGLGFDELVVLLDLSDIPDETVYSLDPAGNVVSRHDTAGAVETAPASAPRKSWIERHSTLLPAASRMLSWLVTADGKDSPEERFAGQDIGLWTLDAGVYRNRRAALGLERAQEHMEQLHGLASARGIPLTIVVYPWPAQVYRRDLDSLQVRTWRSFCARLGIRFLDLFPTFIGTEEPETVLTRDFIPGDVHWSEAGHIRVAEALLADRRRTGARP